MNVEPDLKSLGTQALQDLLNNLTQAKGFILDQAPEFCQQLVARGYIMPLFVSLVCMCLCAAVAACTFLAFRKACRIKKESGEAYARNEEIPLEVGSFFGALATPLLLAISLCHAHTALYVYVAPKVFLVEEITRMLK